MAAKTAGRNELQPSTSHLRDIVRKRDFYAGGLMVLLGLAIALKGATYRAGTLMHMGPGFLPTALGVLLVLLGIAIAAVALAPAEGDGDQSILPANPQWWAWFCILMSPVFFIILRALLRDGACDLLLRLHRSARRQNRDLEGYDRSCGSRDRFRRRAVFVFSAGSNAHFHLEG